MFVQIPKRPPGTYITRDANKRAKQAKHLQQLLSCLQHGGPPCIVESVGNMDDVKAAIRKGFGSAVEQKKRMVWICINGHGNKDGSFCLPDRNRVTGDAFKRILSDSASDLAIRFDGHAHIFAGQCGSCSGFVDAFNGASLSLSLQVPTSFRVSIQSQVSLVTGGTRNIKCGKFGTIHVHESLALMIIEVLQQTECEGCKDAHIETQLCSDRFHRDTENGAHCSVLDSDVVHHGAGLGPLGSVCIVDLSRSDPIDTTSDWIHTHSEETFAEPDKTQWSKLFLFILAIIIIVIVIIYWLPAKFVSAVAGVSGYVLTL